jgi:hypothetical protein
MSTPATPAAASLAKTISIKSPLNRKTDVFDTEDFDAVKFINQIYPDGGRASAAAGYPPRAGILSQSSPLQQHPGGGCLTHSTS